jgi:hypothetical protein
LIHEYYSRLLNDKGEKTRRMPRKHNQDHDVSDETSEWEAEEEERSGSEPVDVESVAEETPARKPRNKQKQTEKPPPAAPQSRKKDIVGILNSVDVEEDGDFLPSEDRKTAKGGYAHTNRSRLKISIANHGKEPWSEYCGVDRPLSALRNKHLTMISLENFQDKGKNRSESAKAAIAAGVQARNREILNHKLEKLGMTEEEYSKKTKEIKYIRERLRRARVQTKEIESIRKVMKEQLGQARAEEAKRKREEASEEEKEPTEEDSDGELEIGERENADGDKVNSLHKDATGDDDISAEKIAATEGDTGNGENDTNLCDKVTICWLLTYHSLVAKSNSARMPLTERDRRTGGPESGARTYLLDCRKCGGRACASDASPVCTRYSLDTTSF